MASRQHDQQQRAFQDRGRQMGEERYGSHSGADYGRSDLPGSRDPDFYYEGERRGNNRGYDRDHEFGMREPRHHGYGNRSQWHEDEGFSRRDQIPDNFRGGEGMLHGGARSNREWDRFGGPGQDMVGYGEERRGEDYRGQLGRGFEEGGAYGRQPTTPHDHDYAQWRREQLQQLDRDYDAYRKERYGKFSDEFNSWRSKRGSGENANPDMKSATLPTGAQQKEQKSG